MNYWNKIPLFRIILPFNCKQVIIDSSVPKYNWEQIKKECLKWDIPFYNVNTQGVYFLMLLLNAIY